MPAQTQFDVDEVVFAGAVGGHLGNLLQVFQQAVVVAVVVQTDHGCRVGKTGEGQTRVVAGHAIGGQSAGVDRRQEARGPQLRGRVGVKGHHQRQRAVADVARFVGGGEGEHPCGGVVSRACVLERPGGAAEHLREAQRGVAVKQLDATGAGGHRAMQGEVSVDHRDAIGAAAAAVVHALQQGSWGHERVGVGVGRGRVGLQAGQHVHAAHVAGDVHHIGANEVTVADGPCPVGHDQAALDVDEPASAIDDVGGGQFLDAQHIRVCRRGQVGRISQPHHITDLGVCGQADAENRLVVGCQSVVAAQAGVRAGQQSDGRWR